MATTPQASPQRQADAAAAGAATAPPQVTRWNATELLKAALLYGGLGMVFGILLVKTEVISWFRIQEMFRFQSFHMYGVIGSAVVTGALSLQLLKRLRVKAVNGQPIHLAPKRFHWGNVWGGILFGLGWALMGACPGPIFALIGAGYWPFLVVLVSALAGTWVYSSLRPRLPH